MQAYSEVSNILNYKKLVAKLSKAKPRKNTKMIKKRGHIFSVVCCFLFFSVQTLTGLKGAVRFSTGYLLQLRLPNVHSLANRWTFKFFPLLLNVPVGNYRFSIIRAYSSSTECWSLFSIITFPVPANPGEVDLF